MFSFHVLESSSLFSVMLNGPTGTRECAQPFFFMNKLFFYMFVYKVFPHLSNENKSYFLPTSLLSSISLQVNEPQVNEMKKPSTHQGVDKES